MKKIFMAIAFVAMLMLPLMSFALSQVSDSDLSTVTGQSGVSINLDVSMDLHADTIAWGDADGIGTALGTGGGWVGLSALDATGIRVRLRQDLGNLANGYKAVMTTQGGIMLTEGGIMATEGGIATTQGGIMGTQGGIMTTQGGIATTQGGIMTTEGGTMLTEAGIATTEGGIMTTEGGTMLTQGGLATTEGGIMLAQGGIMTTEGGIMTTEGGTMLTQGGIATTQGGTMLTEGGTMLTQGGIMTTEYAIPSINAIIVGAGGTGTDPAADLQILAVQQALGVAAAGGDTDAAALLSAGSQYQTAETNYSNAYAAYAPAWSAYSTANANYTAAYSAYGPAWSAYSTAVSAYGPAWSAYSTAYSNYGAATSAYGSAWSAYTTANANYTAAYAAYGPAWSAYSTANSNYNSAYALYGPAWSAYSTAYSNYSAADSAYLTASGHLTSTLTGITPLTIDVATGDQEGFHNVTYVHIGTGALEIGIAGLVADVGLGHYTTGVAPVLTQTLGSIYLGSLLVNVNGASYIDIYKDPTATTTGAGVAIGLNLTIDNITIAAASWGDADGAPYISTDYQGSVSTTAGYVGLRTVDIENLTVVGAVHINVATQSGSTFVRIGFANLGIGMTSMDADVVTAANPALTVNAYTLGSLYLHDLDLHLTSGQVDISAPANSMGVVLTLGVNVNATLGTLAWGDQDGVGTDAAGWVGIRGLTIESMHLGGQVTINVATDNTYFTGSTYVRVGLNAFGISIASMNGDVALGATRYNLNQTLGSFYLNNLHNMVVNGSLDIHTPTATSQGVVLNLNHVNVASLNIDALSWGDIDGIGGTSTAGYVGLKSLAIASLDINGPVSIDVATIRAAATDNYQLYSAVVPIISPSFVHIGLGTGNADDPTGINVGAGTFGVNVLGIKLGSLNADVSLANNNILTTGVGTLGKLYVGGLMVGINGWVDIGAH